MLYRMQPRVGCGSLFPAQVQDLDSCKLPGLTKDQILKNLPEQQRVISNTWPTISMVIGCWQWLLTTAAKVVLPAPSVNRTSPIIGPCERQAGFRRKRGTMCLRFWR